MKRAPHVSGLMFLAAFLVLAASAAPAFAAPAPKAPKYLWNIATVVPKGIGWAQQYEKLVMPTIAQVSNQEIGIKIHWGGVQGKDEEVIKKIRTGKLEGAGLDARGTVLAVKDFSVLTLPFLFEDYDEVDYVRAKMRPAFDKCVEKAGFFLVLWIDQDFDQIYSSRYGFTDPKEFAEARYANWCGDMEKRVIESLGGSTAPAEINSFMPLVKKGTVNAVMAPALWVVGTQLYSVFTCFNPVKIRYSPGSVLISKKVWESIPEEYRKRYMEKRLGLEGTMNNTIRHDNKKAIAAMMRYGIKQTSITDANLKIIKEKTRKVWAEMTESAFPKQLLDEVLSRLSEFRRQKPGKSA